MEVKMHRFILAELNTHRVFSRNSASSRAIPFGKLYNRIMEDPAYPVHWGEEQKGMQSGQRLGATDELICVEAWKEARDSAAMCASKLNDLGLHKSLVNRIIEPFMWHTAIISATEWDNFFWQRCDEAAQPEMKALADRMFVEYAYSTPTALAYGEWHLPYIKPQDFVDARDMEDSLPMLERNQPQPILTILKDVSVARCARVSYLNHDGSRDIQVDYALAQKLKKGMHWSPFEHVATPAGGSEGYAHERAGSGTQDWYGNFHGWKQYRKFFRNENRTEPFKTGGENGPV